MMSGIAYFDPTSTNGSDGYINYKMSGGDKLGSGGGPGCGFLGWVFMALFGVVGNWKTIWVVDRKIKMEF